MALAESVLIGGSYVPKAGFSKDSFEKQRRLERFVLAHARSVGETSEERPYIFVDTHGGLGLWKSKKEKACLGSPILIHRILDHHGIRFRGLVFEKHTPSYEQLKICCAFARTGEVHVYNMDNSRAASVLEQWAREDQVNLEDLPGFIYQDYTGGASVQQVRHLGSGHNMDLLIHFSTQGSRRQRCKKEKLSTDLDLMAFANQLGRQHYFVSEPVGRHSFVFLHCTNNSDEPLTEDFVSVNSEEGVRRIVSAIYTKTDHKVITDSILHGDVCLWEFLRSYHTEHPSQQELIGEGDTQHRLSPPPVDFNPFK